MKLNSFVLMLAAILSLGAAGGAAAQGSAPSRAQAPAPPTRAIGLVAVGGEDLAIGKFHFLGIGIDSYQSPDLNLKTACAGARELQSLLLKQFTFEKADSQLLLDTEASRAGIIGALRGLASRAAPSDSVLIYYAGHGNLDKLTNNGSWIPWDASFETPDRWIGGGEIKDIIKAMPARHVLLISDSCFAGDFFRGQSAPAVPQITDAAVRRAFGLISRNAMTAGGLEPVADGGRDGQSIYTWWLLTSLRETTSPYVLPEEVHDRLKKAVSANEKQKPIYGLLSGVGGEPDGTFVFFRRGTAGLDAAMKEKIDRIQKLQELDSKAAGEARRQQEEIAAKQGQLTALDKRLSELQAKLGAGAGQSGLDAMLAMVREKERQGKELEALRRKADEDLKAREAALADARRRQEADRAKQFQEEFGKYQEICASSYASDEFKAQAWQTLAAAWSIPANTPRDKPLAYAGGKVLVQSSVASTPSTPSIPSTQAGGKNPLTADLGGGVKMELLWVPERGGEGGFWAGKYEVTQEQYEAVTGNNPSSFKGAKNPVETVSWNEAQAFCVSLSKKTGRLFGLPTEKQWEFACRAGSTGDYGFAGGEGQLGDYAWYDGNSGNTTHPVGQKKPNAWGLYDMHGNVWEWCEDAEGGSRVLRGGSWLTYPYSCRASIRNRYNPTYRVPLQRVSGCLWWVVLSLVSSSFDSLFFDPFSFGGAGGVAPCF